ncbi:MAG: hypothetical protein H0U62_09490 [Actinobacteria bacterium]|nr:hypothetical protein [Actinomycetota bacterium]
MLTQPVGVPVRHALPEAANALLTGSGLGATHLLDSLGVLVENQGGLCSWLRSLLDDPARVREIAARSYWHTNGFAKLVLHTASAFRIRLHVWPAGDGRRGETNPHSHRWDFASAVLAGDGLVIIEYEECDDGALYARHRYGRDAPNRAVLTPAGQVRLRPVSERTVPTLGRYATEISTVHTVDPLGSSLVATLVVQGPLRADSTVVYCAPATEAEQVEHILEAFDVRLLVGELLAVIDSTVACCA